ncbi:GCR1-dependent translation factor 1 [Sorochytrium milnesiophthora]
MRWSRILYLALLLAVLTARASSSVQLHAPVADSLASDANTPAVDPSTGSDKRVGDTGEPSGGRPSLPPAEAGDSTDGNIDTGRGDESSSDNNASYGDGDSTGRRRLINKDLATAAVMIVVSEIGDKTFLIAAIMAMTNPRGVIFGAAFSALAVMSVLSAVMGYSLPILLSRRFTRPLAALLFAVFGAKMLWDGQKMPAGNAQVLEEMNEVVEELEAEKLHEMEEGTGAAMAEVTTTATSARGFKKRDEMDASASDTTVLYDASAPDADMPPLPPASPIAATHSRTHTGSNSMANGFRNLMMFLFSPVFVQTFFLTFVAEWGDRSQIATIALASAGSMKMIIIGTVLGHALCTGVAVIGGRLLASRISVRNVTLAGGVLFLVFAALTIMVDE